MEMMGEVVIRTFLENAESVLIIATGGWGGGVWRLLLI